MARALTTVDLEDAYTVPEFADLTRLSIWTIRRYIASGDLDAVKAGRQYLIPRRSADEWLHLHRAGA